MTPREELRREHGNIMKVVSRFQTLIRDPLPPIPELIREFRRILLFMDVYVDRCHHGKEEAILFPGLEASHDEAMAPLVSDLRREHEDARRSVDALRAALPGPGNENVHPHDDFFVQCDATIALMRAHIRKENAVLLPAIERLLTDGAQVRMEAAFQRFEKGIPGLAEVRRTLLSE